MTTYTLMATLLAVAIYLVAILMAGDVLGPIRLITKNKSRYGKDSREYLRLKWTMVIYLFVLGTMTILLPILEVKGIRLGSAANLVSVFGLSLGYFGSKRLMRK